MAKPWNEVIESEEYQALSYPEKERARVQYFDTVVAPNVDEANVAAARQLFDQVTRDERYRLGARGWRPIVPRLPRAARFDDDVDYRSGVGQGMFRAAFSRMDTDEERADWLSQSVGAEGWTQDSAGRYVLTPEGLSEIGIQADTKRAIDESSVTRYDIADWAGDAPAIAGGVGAGFATTGVGAVPGAVIAAGGAAAGKAIDEAVEYFQGHNRQSFGEVAKDVAIEGGLEGGGELAVRSLRPIGSRIMGPRTTRRGVDGSTGAMTRQRNPLRSTVDPERLRLAGNAARLGGQPSIYQATGGGLAGRMQEMIHMVLGNPLEAINRRAILGGRSELLNSVGSGSRVAGAQSGSRLGRRIRAETARLKNSAEQAVTTSRRALRRGVQSVRETFSSGNSGSISDAIVASKRAFSEEMSGVYSGIDNLVGTPVVPTSSLKSMAGRILESFPPSAQGGGSVFLRNELRAELSNIVKMGDAITFEQAHNVRTVLREAAYNPELLPGIPSAQLNMLREAADSMFDDAGDFVVSRVSPILDSAGVPMRVTERFTDERAQVAVRQLAEADELYKEGIRRYDDVLIQRLARREGQHGAIDTHEAAAALWRTASPDRIEKVRALVPERVWGDMLNTHMNSMLTRFSDESTGMLNATSMMNHIANNRSSFNAMYGKEANELFRTIRDLSATNTRLNLNGLRDSSQLVRVAGEARRRQEALDLWMSRGLVKKVAAGQINDDQLVGYIFRQGKETNITQMREIREFLGPESVEWQGIQQKAMQQVLEGMMDRTSDPVKVLLSGQSLRRQMERYGRTNLIEMFGRETYGNLDEYARTVQLLTEKSRMTGGIVAAGIALHPMKNIGRLAMMSAMGRWMRSNGVKYYTEGLRAPRTRAGVENITRGIIALGVLAEDETTSDQDPMQEIQE